MSRSRIAAVQMTSTHNVKQNLDTALGLAKQASEDGARLVLLPECFSHYGPGNSKLDHAEPLSMGSVPGPILSACQSLCISQGVELILGGFWECSPDAGKVYNSSVHLDVHGSVRAVYRKIHLFDVDLPDGTRIRESSTMAAGDAPVVTDSCVGRVGMSICYDVRFPELYRKLVNEGANVMTVPAAFALATGKDHWHVLLRARAIESQCYIVAAAQTGHHFGGRTSYGHALICDPWGTVLSQCGAGDGYAIATLDLSYVQQVRNSVPSLRHRRL